MSDESPTILTPPPAAPPDTPNGRAPQLALAPIVPTCGMCRHWHHVPPQAHATAMGRAVEVGGPPMGECRESPPQVIVIPEQLPDGRVMPNTGVLYPQMVAGFPGCGRFAFRLELLGQAKRVGG